MSNVGLGAEELLNILLAQGQQCASPGATSQGSQRALPEGEPMDVEEIARRTSLEMANFPHFFPPPPLPEWSSLAAAGMYPQQATLSPIPIKPGEVISTGTAEARTLGEVISPLADVVMGNTSRHSRASTPHQSLMVSGPPSPRSSAQEKTFMDWSERNTKRPLEGAGGETRDKKAASSSSDPPIFQPLITGERQISDAKFFVKRVGQENEELGRLLGEENRIAQMAAQDHLQRSHLSDEYRQAEFQKFKQTADDLARAYQVQSDANCQQVLSDRENGMKVNLELRGELCSSAQRYEQFEADAKTQIQRLNDAANYWRAESEQESRVATSNSEQSNEAMQRCMTAETALRQKVLANLPQNQVELRGIIGRIEQDAMQHVQATELRTENLLEQSSKHARLLNEEIYARNVGIHMATQRGDKAEAEVARIELLLAQEKAALFRARHGQSETHEVAVHAQRNYVQSLKTVDGLKTEYGDALQSFQEEAVMYHEETNQCYEEDRLYVEAYDCWQNLLCATPVPPVLPPGLSASEAGQSAKPRVAAPAPTKDSRYEEVTLKIKEADKLHAPAYPTITNLASWQSNLTQQLVQTSGVREVETIIQWITEVWTRGAKFEDFATSGGPEFVTLDVKLSTAMQLIISHGGQDAKDLKDLINRKMDEALKSMKLLKDAKLCSCSWKTSKPLTTPRWYTGLITWQGASVIRTCMRS